MSHFMPPALLALFAPRPAPTFMPPPEREPKPELTGLAQYVKEFDVRDEQKPEEEFETPQKRKERVRKERAAEHEKVLEDRTKNCKSWW